MKNLFIYTIGCKINQHESQIIKEKYCSEDIIYTDNIEKADTIIINTCTFTEQAAQHCRDTIKHFHTQNRNAQILLTGCFAKVSKLEILKDFPFAKVIDKDELLKDVKQKIKNFDNNSRALVKIQDGCNSFCSYCIIPYARNVLWSKPVDETISEINNLINAGYSEIILTGVHITKYDKGLSFLLSQIYKKINKNFRIRLSSIEINGITDDLIEIMKEEKDRFCHYLHVPLQSASDKVLKDMNRQYSSKEYLKKINLLKQNFNDISITTDIICGFPTETNEDFDITYKFLKENEFAKIHAFPFSPRIGTKAFSLRQVFEKEEVRRRLDMLTKLSKDLETKYFNRFLNTKRKAVYLIGNKALTDNYLTIENIEETRGIFEVEIKHNIKNSTYNIEHYLDTDHFKF